jgi:Leucine-rich repeat (LRR) protein
MAFSLLVSLQVQAAKKIISGLAPEVGHPGEFNTVALVKPNGKIFCSGSIIAPNLIATAKHCLVNKDSSDFKIYFGDNTNAPTESLYREVIDFEVRYPKDWSMMFPSFDVGWVEFKGALPEGFKPLPILSTPDSLSIGHVIHQVGYGNRSPRAGTIKAGIKLRGLTHLQSYVNNPRFFNILVFKGDEGQGSCHGDSGGPAYAYIEGHWYIVGVTNGFDLVLTPRSMLRTGDPDFPYTVNCSKNQSLYNFLGAHGKWIEESSGEKIRTNIPFLDQDRKPTQEHKSLKQWCEATDIGSPSWNLLKVLLDKRVDQMDQASSVNFYNDCDVISQYLANIEEINLYFKTTMTAKLSFQSLILLPKLRSLRIANFPKGMLNLKTISGLNLDTLVLKNLGMTNLDAISDNTVRDLSLKKNPLTDLSGIKKIKHLQSLNISNTKIRSLKALEDIPLKNLIAGKMDVDYLSDLESLSSNIETIDFRNTNIVSHDSVMSRFTSLKRLWLTGDTNTFDLSENVNLEFIALRDFKSGAITFPRTLKKLVQLSASNCELQSLDFISSAIRLKKAVLSYNQIKDLRVFEDFMFPHLESLNLSLNPIVDLSPVKNLKDLKILRVFQTPLKEGEVPKTEENCPTIDAPSELSQFCSK